MKIAFVTPEYVTEKNFDGGLANYLFKISKAMNKKGHKVYIIVSSNKNEIISHEDITVIRVSIHSHILNILKITSIEALWYPAAWVLQSMRLNNALKELNKKVKIDIVQFTSYMAVGIAVPANIRSVSRISSFQPLMDQAYERKITFAKKICNYLEISALKKSDRIYSPSRLLAKTVCEVVDKEIDIIETPLVTHSTKDETVYLSRLNKKKYLLFFGTIGLLKGVKEISQILPRFFELNPDTYFVFAGKDTIFFGQSMVQYIKSQAGIYNEKCIFLGSLQQPQLQPVIKRAQLIVLPSRVDNLPNTCIESMSLGKIVIGTKGASFDQLITDGINGFLCAINDPESLLESIMIALNLTGSEKVIIEKNALIRTKKLKPELISEQLEDLFKEVLTKI